MMIDKDFLKNFDQRMKCVGRYSVLCSNSFDKKLWKEYGIETRDEQMNMLFTLLLFIMEYSLREENCTMDEIASFVEDISYGYYGRKLNFEKSQEFARFMVEDILGNSGSSMYFKAFDYEKRTCQDINIRYIDNKVVYLENGVRRTSYYLTDEGYNMILATMEMENNLKLSVHEMLFKLHMEKADYNRAVEYFRSAAQTEPEDRGGNFSRPEKRFILFRGRVWKISGGQYQHRGGDQGKVPAPPRFY